MSTFRKPWVIVVALFALALLLNLPYLWGGFQGDDLLFVGLLREDPLRFSHWMGMWSVDDIEMFHSLWWRDPDFAASFWRPLPSLIIEGSIRLFGENPFPLHLLSLLLHGAVAAILFLVVRRITGDHLVAALSGFLFVTCEDHSLGIGWISTVTDLMCVLGILGALWAHVVWLQERKPSALALSLLALALAFVSKESAATAPLALALLTFLVPRGREEGEPSVWRDLGTRVRSVLRDPLSWAPAMVLLVVYLGAYKGLGLGQMNNLMYNDPFGQPLAYMAWGSLYLPVLWLATLTPMTPSLALFVPASLVPLAVLGAIAFACALLAWWPFRHRPIAVWAFATWTLALLPQLGTDPSERAMYFPFAAASILLALLLAGVLPAAWRKASDVLPRASRLGGWYVALGIALPGLLLSATMPNEYRKSLQLPEKEALTALPHIRDHHPDHVVALNTSGMFVTFYVGGALAFEEGGPVDVRLLSSCNGVLSVERVDEDSIVIRTDRPGWLSNLFARAVRTVPHLEMGRTYERDLFTAVLLETTPDGSDALAVRFDMALPLDDPRVLFLSWNGESFEPIDLLGLPVGERIPLWDSSNVWEALM
jgi:hypothetical protein